MRILIAGGSGLIGSALVRSLAGDGHQVWVLTRSPDKVHLPEGVKAVGWDGRTTSGWGELVSQSDVIVNLAGESLGAGPWNRARKARIISSRVQAGQALTEAVRLAQRRPKVFIQASAVGFYGPHGLEKVTEETGPGSDYLNEICSVWEASSQPVEELGVRRVIIRTGMVLARHAGALPPMMLPFKWFIGGPLGNGKQGIPWIHLADEVAAIRFLVENEKAGGVFNLSAPNPLSNADFGRALAKAMHRPFWLPAPAFALRILLGEMSTLILDGQYMVPRRLLEAGFHFRFENTAEALLDLL